MGRTRAFAASARSWAAGVTVCLAALTASAPSQAGEQIADFSNVVDENGPASQSWFGYRSDDVQIYAHPDGGTGTKTVMYGTDGTAVTYEIDAEILSGDDSSLVGLICCRPRGTERGIVLAMDRTGKVVVLVLNDDGEPRLTTGLGGPIDTPGRAVLRMVETGHGFEAFVNGESVGAISEAGYDAGRGGIFARNGGIYAVHDFGIYLPD